MKEISHRLRKAYYDLLNPFVIEGVTIPIFDQRVNPETTIPTYRGGNTYVLITNQTEVETTNNQCTFRKQASITLDIVTKYPLNHGGSLASELISDAIQQEVHLKLSNPIAFTGFQVLSTKLEFSRAMIENGDTQTAYRKLLAFSHSIYEL